MSSTPFCLGLPIVDILSPENGGYVLRSKDRSEAIKEIKRIRELLTLDDVISWYYIGNRPDSPIPVSRYFTEVNIEIGQAEKWMRGLCISAWSLVTTGKRKL